MDLGDVQVRELPEQPTVVVPLMGPLDRLEEMLAQAFEDLRTVPASGPRYARYFRMAPMVEVEAGVPVSQPMEVTGLLRASQLPACRAAMVHHRGPFDTLEAAYRLLEDWMDLNGKQPAGPPWEVYTRWGTEVYWPIEDVIASAVSEDAA